MNKISPEAEKVRNALLSKGIETPMITPEQDRDTRRAGLNNICVK